MASGITFKSKKMRDLEAAREGNPVKGRRYTRTCFVRATSPCARPVGHNPTPACQYNILHSCGTSIRSTEITLAILHLLT